MKKASSLVLVLLITATVASLALATQRVGIYEFHQSASATDNIKALSSAQAAARDALLRVRANRNAETKVGQQVMFDLTDGILAEDTESKVVTEADGQVSSKYSPQNLPRNSNSPFGRNFIYSPKHQYYEFTIDYKTYFVGKDYTNKSVLASDLNSAGGGLDIAKDNAIEFSGFNKNGSQINYAFAPLTGTSPANLPLVQIQTIYENTTSPNSNGIYKPIDLQFSNPNEVKTGYIPTQDPDYGGVLKTIRIRSYKNQARYSMWVDSVPKLDPKNKFGSFETTIIATGIFGDATVKMVYKINRVTGQLISIADFNAYAKGNVSP